MESGGRLVEEHPFDGKLALEEIANLCECTLRQVNAIGVYAGGTIVCDGNVDLLAVRGVGDKHMLSAEAATIVPCGVQRGNKGIISMNGSASPGDTILVKESGKSTSVEACVSVGGV